METAHFEKNTSRIFWDEELITSTLYGSSTIARIGAMLGAR